MCSFLKEDPSLKTCSFSLSFLLLKCNKRKVSYFRLSATKESNHSFLVVPIIHLLVMVLVLLHYVFVGMYNNFFTCMEFSYNSSMYRIIIRYIYVFFF